MADDDNWWGGDAFATASSAKASFGGSAKPKTSPQDLKDLSAASATAENERDSMREYGQARKAVKDFGTSPWRARLYDMATPDQDGGIMDTIGAVIGSPVRWLTSDKTLAARDQLNTVSAKVALAGSQQMKGSSSDKDTALMRMGGVSPYKSETENNRIIDQAVFDSGLAQTRAKMKSGWIAKFGSLGNASPNGTTFQDAVSNAERDYRSKMGGAMNGGSAPKRLPPAPVASAPTANPHSGWSIQRVQ